MEKVSNIFLFVISVIATISLMYNILYNVMLSTAWTVFFIILFVVSLAGIMVAFVNLLHINLEEED